MSAHPAADVITRMLHAIDDLDWDGVRRAFADPVHVDYSSLSGQPSATVPLDVLLDSWRSLLPGFDATQHISGPVVVDEAAPDEVIARTAVRGYHMLGGDEWIVAGRYTITLRRRDTSWRITAITLTVLRQTGVLTLPEAARTRAAANQGRSQTTR